MVMVRANIAVTVNNKANVDCRSVTVCELHTAALKSIMLQANPPAQSLTRNINFEPQNVSNMDIIPKMLLHILLDIRMEDNSGVSQLGFLVLSIIV